ncbi:Ubiquinone biosynthesis hydroxylase, UbiH/UbiF/VisC/COQ6 family [Microbulbifer donghaiensis]|uniref:Ubiquinone biosynthesis hydroxylase, UbiH/UbiF/VisC/COQ6 family n=1 Tax=Microbulbifer donghaiensis TaxID=494016 RepID=A0A1M4YSQ2_9GAMM|nr:5-demethoxyubiquinol-8 5-hydroxylase UbiM [Microbulbifer donghaiensis]SHF08830.1 Ubiquinone biosynthesis hydroxylase, UbiH/UbiF/VisC/COQ6 family [Microbulbifer donghaiensis]
MQTDIAVIGAGPAGLAFTAFLANRGYRITLVDRQSREELAAPQDDGREIALTHKSVRLLKSLGAWQRLQADEVSELASAQVVNGRSPYCLQFDDRGPLGYIVPNAAIRRVLHEVVSTQQNVQFLDNTAVVGTTVNEDCRLLRFDNGEQLAAALVVAADSRFSDTRRVAGIGADMRDFGRVAIVGRVRTDKPHENIARECFRYGSTLALLPLADAQLSSAVVTVPASRGSEMMALSDDDFAGHVARESGDAPGSVTCVGKRHSYPLVAVYAKNFCTERMALIGDAAVGMHPVTAHGFNLGLASADSLAHQLQRPASLRKNSAQGRALAKYQFIHRLESLPIYQGTNRVVGLFTDDRWPAKFLRKAVLRVSNNFSPIRRAITYQLTR